MTNTDLLDEKITELLQDPHRCKEGFSIAVKEYSKQLYWQIRRMVFSHNDANDILQNTLLKAWSNIAMFRGEAKLLSWLYRIAINESMTFLAKERQSKNILLSGEGDYQLYNIVSDEYFNGDKLERALQEAIMRLPDKQRLVFNMKYFDNMKYDEISCHLGTSVGALKSSYHLAVKKIEEYIVDP